MSLHLTAPVRRHHGAITALLSAVRERQPWPTLPSDSNVTWISVESWDACVETVCRTYANHLAGTTPTARPVVLAATRKVVDDLNQALQTQQQGKPDDAAPFQPGDRVMYRRNHPMFALANGSRGTVVATQSDSGIVEWELPDGTIQRLPYTPQTPMILAYAMTVHKSQGSEWPTVIVVAPHRSWFDDTASPDDDAPDDDAADSATNTSTATRTPIPGWHDRRLAYTALSRAQHHLIIISGLPYDDLGQMVNQLPVKRQQSQLSRSLGSRKGRFAIPWAERATTPVLHRRRRR